MLGRDQSEEGADGVAREPVPVTDLDRQPKPGQRRYPTQAAQPVHHGSELGIGGHRCDRRIQTIPEGQGSQHGLVLSVESHPGRRVGKVLAGQPRVVSTRPGRPAGVDDAVAQQQLRDPVPGAHQVPAAVLPRPHQVPGGFLLHPWNRHRGDLIQAQQSRQVHRVPGVGLHPVARGALQLRRGRHHAPDPIGVQRPGQSEAGRAGLVGHRHRTGQVMDPGADVAVIRGQSCLDEFAGGAVDRLGGDRSCVHIQADARTLCIHRGLPLLSDRPGKGHLVR